MKRTLKYTTPAGRARIWSVEAFGEEKGAFIKTTFGAEGGIMQESVKAVRGKNKGKTNETTPLQQAILEAEALYSLKEKKTGRASNMPMLAQTYKGGARVLFPCFVQPKLDGIRGIFHPSTSQIYSREGNVFSHLEHILDELKDIPWTLDGEIYSEELNFEDLKGLISRSDHCAEKLLKLQYCVFDVAIESLDFSKRLEILKEIFCKRPRKFFHVVSVETLECKNEAEIEDFLRAKTYQGYEGVMVRNKGGLYAFGKRSFDLQKYKLFLDDEFMITGYKRERASNGIVWTCQTRAGAPFSVKPKGTFEARALSEKEAAAQVGKMLTVKYQELSAAGVPRFPVGVAIRDYE